MTATNGAAAATERTVAGDQIGECREGLPDTKSHPTPAIIINALAELYPAAFVAERWQPHRPLKTGIHLDLIATGVVTPVEVAVAMRSYTNRRTYLLACTEGAGRIDLDGQACGAVTAGEAQWAATRRACLDAKQAEVTAAQRAARQTKKRGAEKPPQKPNGACPHHREAKPEIIAPAPPQPVPVGGDSLAALRAAAAARRAASAPPNHLNLQGATR